jgi:hypothetical protein
MGYNRSGTRFKQRLKRRRREQQRLEKKAATTPQTPAAGKAEAAGR